MRLCGSGWVDSHCGGRLPPAAIMFCHRFTACARIEAGLGHQLLADHVGFGFLYARARQQEPVCASTPPP